jgi:hypothetical protein
MNNFLQKVTKMKTLLNKIRNNKGNSLAEFAVTAAMMATLATTAAPRFAGVGDTAKANQTRANLDKIASIINQFYMDKGAPISPQNGMGEGQGRIPGQVKFDVPVGGYSDLFEVKADLMVGGFDKWDNGTEAVKWRSIFGKDLTGGDYLGEYSFSDDPPLNGEPGYNGGNDEDGTPKYPYEEWNAYLSQSEGPIKSPYTQGHYIYVVIPGGTKYSVNDDGSEGPEINCNSCGPIVVVADAYNPSKYWLVKSFN